MRTGLIGVMTGVAAAAVLVFVVWILELHGHSRVRDGVTAMIGLLGIALVFGYLAWQHRRLFVTAIATAAILFAGMAAGYAAWAAYLLAVTPSPPPGAFDWDYGYTEDTVHIAILFGLAVASGIITALSVLFARHQSPDRHRQGI